MAKLRLQLKSEEAKAAGLGPRKKPGRHAPKPDRFQSTQTPRNPTKIKNSLNPRIDQVYHYEGDLNADGTNEVGQVSFFGTAWFPSLPRSEPYFQRVSSVMESLKSSDKILSSAQYPIDFLFRFGRLEPDLFQKSKS